VAACDTNPSRLIWARHLFAPPVLYGTPAELLGCTGLDAVLVLTPPSSHAENVIRALGAGLHVLVEKPMALDPDAARQMAQAALLARRHLQVGFSRRFREPYRNLRKALQEVEPRHLRRVCSKLAFPTASWKAESDFLGNESRGGGVLDDVLSHQVDLVCWLMRGRPDRVSCVVKRSSGAVSAELEIGGVTVRCDSAHGRYAERLETEFADGRVLEASGSRMAEARSGFKRWRRGRALLLDRVSLLGDRLLRRPNVSLRSFEGQLRDFVGATRGGSSDGATAEDGLQAVEIVQACRASAQQEGAWQALATTTRPAG
jgi:myo-inositol 2-dehydrogenase/D-chiro-inositol 1-dehydrogenase